jgi:uncharacterized spore protein YtfJ
MRKFLRSPIGISLLLSLALWLAVAGFYGSFRSSLLEHAVRGGREIAPQSIVVVTVDDLPVLGAKEEAVVISKLRRFVPGACFLM